jgi:hypothetical protein
MADARTSAGPLGKLAQELLIGDRQLGSTRALAIVTSVI